CAQVEGASPDREDLGSGGAQRLLPPTEDIFGQAFANYARSMRKNQQLGARFEQAVAETGLDDAELAHLGQRMHEMQAFYALMDEYNQRFLADWRERVRPAIAPSTLS
ncbi:hypothetical protein RZS08_24105, partial [Arthrospira platensis SPKY1]|nr:hypothetical protein [Arthrospira platensis SPKY1]